MNLAEATVLVTTTSFGRYDPSLRSELEQSVGQVIYNPTGKPLSSAQVAQLLPGVDGYIAGLDQIDRAALAGADRLKVIARYGVGLDAVDLPAAREKGITVTFTPGVNSVSVAELAIGLMLALLRQLPQALDSTRQGRFDRLSGSTLEGKTVGIIGLGAIGKQLARRLAAFDCRLLACEPNPDRDFLQTHPIELLPLADLLPQADILSLHLPLDAQTRGMVDQAFLAAMKPGALLINTARGGLMDENALLQALSSGHLGGAGLDALAVEPVTPENPLLKLPQVIITPHLGSQTDNSANRMGRLALDDCLRVLRGDPPLYPVP